MLVKIKNDCNKNTVLLNYSNVSDIIQTNNPGKRFIVLRIKVILQYFIRFQFCCFQIVIIFDITQRIQNINPNYL